MVFLLGGFVFISPSLLTPDLIYPERIDSTYLVFHADKMGDTEDSLLFNPSDVDLNYTDITVKTDEGFLLNGWFIKAVDTPANTILILHDINESRIIYLDHLRQFHDRGLNVAVFDLRAHGSSGGNEFTPGLPAVNDVNKMVDSVLGKKGTKHMVLMGVGIGAAIALQSAVYDDRVAGLVLQSPFNTYEIFLDRYSRQKWGVMRNIWYPVFKRRTEELLQYSLKELDLREIAAYVTIPSLYIIGSDDKMINTSETLQVFDASATEKKELFLVRNAAHSNIAKSGGEAYYNRIAAFLISNLPKEQKITRYKKLALNDY
jgi:alpha-beta hydrolase superfamily lysophospholipase